MLCIRGKKRMEQDVIFENAGKAMKWLDENENWEWDENGFIVLKTNDVPDFVKQTIERINRGVLRENKNTALQQKLEGR